MKKTRLALLGCGRLNEIVASALDSHLPEYELVGVMGRNPQRTQAFAERYGGKACMDIQELMALKPDFVAEAASPQAVREYAEPVLKGGSNFVVLTVGAFADAAFFHRVKETAAEYNQKVYIASGAVGGFDVLRTAALMSPIKATMTSKKSLRSLSFTPFFQEELLTITEPEQVFTGSTKEAIEVLPFHFNVAVATALASAGPEQTTLNIDAVPNFIGDEYKIEIQGEEVRTDLNIYSRTPRIAAWSIVAVLRNAVSPIVF
jgi:aspartate dehydrogenase